MKVSQRSAVTLAVLVLIFTMYPILLQIGGTTIGLVPQLFYAFFVGFVASLVLSFATDRCKGLISIMSNPKMLLGIVAAGIINNAIRQLFLGYGTLGTNPNIASIVYRSWVIIAAVFTPIVLKNRIGKIQSFAIFLGFLGLYLTVSGGAPLAFDYSDAPYMGFVLISAFCSATITLAMSKYTFNIYGAAAVFNLVSFALLGIIAAATGTSLTVNFPPSSIFTVAFLGVFGFAIATSLYYHAVKLSGPQIVGNAMLAIPFVTFALSAIILSLPIEPYYIIAALLISAGYLLQKRYSSAPERITTKGALKRTTVYDITGAFSGNRGKTIANHIKGGNRAFAIKTGRSPINRPVRNMFAKRNCTVFTSNRPHPEMDHDEVVFTREILNLRKGETALIGIGRPNNLEDAFGEFVAKANPPNRS